MILFMSVENQITLFEVSGRSKNFDHLRGERYLAGNSIFFKVAGYYTKSEALRMLSLQPIGMYYTP
tara:strand:- start:327 stop:524 length:198 start_codon:yes stop_codon:yes gene_type:complete